MAHSYNDYVLYVINNDLKKSFETNEIGRVRLLKNARRLSEANLRGVNPWSLFLTGPAQVCIVRR